MTEEIRTKFNEFFEFIKPKLEPQTTYYSYQIVEQNGSTGRSFYKIVDGIFNNQVPDFERLKDPEDEKRAKELGLNIREIFKMPIKLAKVGDFILYTISLENGFTYEKASPEKIIEIIALEMKQWLTEGVKSEILIHFGKDHEVELDIYAKHFMPEGIKENSICVGSYEIKSLYYALECNLDTLFIQATTKQVDFQSIPEIPGLIKLYTPAAENLEMEENNIDEVFEFFESESEAKFQKALQIIQNNSEFTSKAEKRYLQFIQLRLGADKGLESFYTAKLKRKEIEKLNSKYFDKNFLSLSYMDHPETDMVVNFLGALVLNHVDVDEYQKQAEACETEDDLIRIYQQTAKKVRKGILDEAKTCPKSWFSQLSLKFGKFKAEKLMFEKTSFDCSGKRMKAFMFYLNLNHNKSVYFDVFQSDTPNFTNFFWFLSAVPTSNWGDVELNIPESSLKFQRNASYRIGDDGKWKILSSPKTN